MFCSTSNTIANQLALQELTDSQKRCKCSRIRLFGDLGVQLPVVRQHAAGALGNLAMNAANQITIVQAGAIVPLVGLLTHVDTWVIHSAVRTLARIFHKQKGDLP